MLKPNESSYFLENEAHRLRMYQVASESQFQARLGIERGDQRAGRAYFLAAICAAVARFTGSSTASASTTSPPFISRRVPKRLPAEFIVPDA